jgi:hypothetical protein
MLHGNTGRMPARRIRFARAGVLGLMLLVLVAGCSLSSVKKSIDKINRENSATGSLESFITSELATKFHRPVRSVSCTPYVDQVLQGDVLTNSLPDSNSGWNIYPTRGSMRFQALVLGPHLVVITPHGTRALS